MHCGGMLGILEGLGLWISSSPVFGGRKGLRGFSIRHKSLYEIELICGQTVNGKMKESFWWTE